MDKYSHRSLLKHVYNAHVYNAPVSAGVRRYSQAEVACLAKFLELYLAITSLQKIYYIYLIFILACIVKYVCNNLDVVPLEVYKVDIQYQVSYIHLSHLAGLPLTEMRNERSLIRFRVCLS